jgi:hypothetical protein
LWIKGSIKINWRKKIRSIQRLRFNQGALRVQLGVKIPNWVQVEDAKQRRHSNGDEEKL